MNPFTRLKPVWQKKKTLSPILVPACQHITGEWVSHVTSSLRDCEGQARCTQIGGRTERRTEGKVKGRWKRGGGNGKGGEEGVLSHHRPRVFIFSPYYLWPPLTPVTQSHKPWGQWGDLGGPSQPDERLKAILITVTASKYGNFGGAGRDKRERKRSRGRITAKFAHCQTNPLLQA